jgi:aminocarboxymuconate-semialdehyde decarboxylase
MTLPKFEHATKSAVNRRHFLKSAATAALIGAYPRRAAMADKLEDNIRVDVHAHYFPTEYLDVLVRYGSTATGIARNLLSTGSQADLNARFDMMDQAGVHKQILSASPQLPYFEVREHAVSGARMINDLYADLVHRHPTRFLAFAATPMPHVDAAIEEMSRALDALGMVGVTVLTSVLGRSLVDPEFEPFWAELNRRGTILFIHPAGVGACSPLIQSFNLNWPIGAPIEDTVAVMHLIVKQIPQRYPRIRIIASHLGGALPMLMQRLDNQASWFMPKRSESPSATARKMWFDTVAHGYVPALQCACAAFGAERLLFGSDYPYELHEMYQRAVSYIQKSGLPQRDITAILDRNAFSLLRNEKV